MVSSSYLALSVLPISPTISDSVNVRDLQKKIKFGFDAKPSWNFTCNRPLSSSSPSSSSPYRALQRSVPLAASVAILLWSNPANAGFLSGIPGIESVPGPQLPEIEFLNRFNEENQKKYAEFDERFKSSPLLKRLLEQTKLNKEKNKQEILDKYCLRGAEWGVGDCSTEGMTQVERDAFISMLKERIGGIKKNHGLRTIDVPIIVRFVGEFSIRKSGWDIIKDSCLSRRQKSGNYSLRGLQRCGNRVVKRRKDESECGFGHLPGRDAYGQWRGSYSSNGIVSRFPVDHDINSKIYLWRGNPWNLEVDAVVNSANESLDEAHSSPGLHAAAGPGLAEECATLGGCRTGMAKVTNAYDLPARKVIHTVGPKYTVKYHTAAENALSHCYRSCLEYLIDNGLWSIAMGCIYTEAKNYPREPAAHVAIRTVRRFLEKQKDKIMAVVFCTTTSSDTEIYKRLLPLYFPRDKHEEEVAALKLPADVGDENGETILDERKIRINPLRAVTTTAPKLTTDLADLPVSDVGLTMRWNSSYLISFLDPAFISLHKDPDQRRKEQWEKAAQARRRFNCAKLLGFGDLGGPSLSLAEEYSLHSRYLAKTNSLDLSEIAEMKIVYRGGVDSEGRPVMVVVGAHFLLRCLDLERFVLYVVKEFEPIIQKPYTIVYFHSAASLQLQPDLGWMRRLQQILGWKHQRNLHAIYVLHPTLGLKTAVVALQLFVDVLSWKKVGYVDRLLQLFRYVRREQLTIPDFVFQHDQEVNGGKGLIVDPRPKYTIEVPIIVRFVGEFSIRKSGWDIIKDSCLSRGERSGNCSLRGLQRYDIGGVPMDSGDNVVRLDQVPCWSDTEQRSSLAYDIEDPNFYFSDPLTSSSAAESSSSSNGIVSRFPVDHEINSRIYLWRGNPWFLEVDAVVNSSNESLDEAHSSPGLHAAAGPGLAEECATLGGCRTGMAKVTNAYDLPARKVIHTVGPKYAVKYHTAAENALSHCYRSCLEYLIENGLRSIAMGCIYTEAKNYPREPAAHVAIRTVRRFLEKQKDKIMAVVFCTTTSSDTEIYKRLLPLYFPRDKHEEEVAVLKLPADVGDENGETILDERKIRIKPLRAVTSTAPKLPSDVADLPVSDVGLTMRRNSSYLESFLDPAFMSILKDPDQRRMEQWEKATQARNRFNCAKLLGFGDLGGPSLSVAEEYSLHSRYLAKANSLNLSEIADMKIVYRGGVDSEGRPVMVVVGAHFLLRCLDLERFVFYVVKEFEPIIQKPYTIVYFHSAASLQLQPDLGWMRRLQQILGWKHQRNLHAIYVLHPTLGLKTAVAALQLFVDALVWKKVVYVDRLLQLFKYVPREQLTIPDFVFQHDLEVNGGKGLIVDPRPKYVYHRP
ncbi:hypothetical protein NE237_021414 [Protea cynaroides]|uniref:Appr-1-p processing enzyme family protein n=1 Tax=Protea cynaroides TaxID=273540 RepID=A0A9Q0K2K5_9MAGN|nr:hypothetical protein NE237_021414 [Protea cynaroides]